MKKLDIVHESASILTLLSDGCLLPFTSLMDFDSAREISKKGVFKNTTIPFPLVLTPGGIENEQVLANSSCGDVLKLMLDGKDFGDITVDKIDEIDPMERLYQIYATKDTTLNPGVSKTYKNIGRYSISGDFRVNEEYSFNPKSIISEAKERVNAKNITAVMMLANPFHRAHERIIRESLNNSDMVVIFLLRHYFNKNELDYEIRHETIDYFIEKYLPKNRVTVIPLSIPYSYAGNNELLLNSMIAANLGCNKMVIGQSYPGLGIYYEKDRHATIFDTFENLDIDVDIVKNFIYCSICKTIVTPKSCKHSHNQHVKYHSPSILELLKSGILPPAILMRKDISAIILSKLFPKRFKNIEIMSLNLFPSTGIVEEISEFDFYQKLMKLYQTSSLT